MTIAYVLPTHNRPEVLDRTLRALGDLPPHDAEVVIADNASEQPVRELLREGLGGSRQSFLTNGLPVHAVRLRSNMGAAGRNAAVEATDQSCAWVVMLDDDSHPLDLGVLSAITAASPDTAAIAGEIFLGSRSASGEITIRAREAGGLPEVFIGCGCAIRRDAYLDLGGYDASFNYYAEEYDLAARMIASGMRIATDRRARFLHEKTPSGRDMNTILARLVRNNGWVMQRYAPEHPHTLRRRVLRETVERYARIAEKEHATTGFNGGIAELLSTLRAQARTPLTPKHWDRFTGRSAARRGLIEAWAGFNNSRGFSTACLVDEGKGADIIREVLETLGVRIVADERDAEALVIGTLSPGPMWEAMERRKDDPRVIAPWRAASTNDRRAMSVERRAARAI